MYVQRDSYGTSQGLSCSVAYIMSPFQSKQSEERERRSFIQHTANMKDLDVRGITITTSRIAASADAVFVAAAAAVQFHRQRRLIRLRRRLNDLNGLRRHRRFHRGRESAAPKRGPIAAGRPALLQQNLLNVPAAAAEGARMDGKMGDPYLEGERAHCLPNHIYNITVFLITLLSTPVSP